MELTTPRYSDDHPDPQSFGKVILATVVVVALGIATVYPVHLPISYYESDFLDYCVGIEALDDIKLKAPSKRSNLAALLFNRDITGLSGDGVVLYWEKEFVQSNVESLVFL